MAVRQIRPDGLGDFTTIAAWLASLPGTLTEDEIAEITGTINATGTPTNFQVVTSPTARIIIRAASGQETTYRSADGKARIDFGAFDFVINSTSSKHVTIENVAIYLGVGSSSQGLFMDPSGAPSGADWQFRNLFIAKGGTNNAMSVSRPFTGLVIENCIIFGLARPTNTGVVLRNSTLVAGFTPVDLRQPTADKGTVERCYFANNTNSLGQLFSADSSADLAFSDTNKNRNIAGTVVTNAALLDQYVDPQNGDWSFKAGNALQGAGSGGADIGFVVPGGSSGGAVEALNQSIAVGSTIGAQASIQQAIAQALGIGASSANTLSISETLDQTISLGGAQGSALSALEAIAHGFAIGASVSDEIAGAAVENLSQGMSLGSALAAAARASAVQVQPVGLAASVVGVAASANAMNVTLSMSDQSSGVFRGTASLEAAILATSSISSTTMIVEALQAGILIGNAVSSFLAGAAPDPRRVLRIVREDRTMKIEAENRTHRISASVWKSG